MPIVTEPDRNPDGTVKYPTRHFVDAQPDSNPCEHAFPYTVTDGKADIEPCRHCSTPWERRNDNHPNAFVHWAIPKGVRFGPTGPSSTFRPAQQPEEDPGWFTFDKEQR